MSEGTAAVASALWLGIMTSISPCPLATNIAAISFIGRKLQDPRRVILSGLLYTLGRVICYAGIGGLLVGGLLQAPGISYVLQKHMNMVLGPVLVLAGILLLGWIPMENIGFKENQRVREWSERAGLWSALPLGFLFALAFCPTSAALFFGGLIPLALKRSSMFLLPSLYGAGTGLPVALFAILIVLGVGWLGRAFRILDRLEKWARLATAGVFIAVGGHLSLITMFQIDILANLR